MAPQGDNNKLAKIGEVFSHVNRYYTVRSQTHRPGVSAAGAANLPAATQTAQHYRGHGEKQLVEMNSEEAAQKLGGLAIADHGVCRSYARLGCPFRARHEMKHRF